MPYLVLPYLLPFLLLEGYCITRLSERGGGFQMKWVERRASSTSRKDTYDKDVRFE